MVETREECARRRAALTANVGGSSPVGNNDHQRPHASAPNPGRGGEERPTSSQHPSEQHPSVQRSVTVSSLGRPSPPEALRMAQELLRYTPAEGTREAWLARIT